jgi:hypothetical protein
MWVLVIILFSYGGPQGNTNVTLHDFSNQSSCEAAKTFVTTAKPGAIKVDALCTPK